jgi:hypothetical protein
MSLATPEKIRILQRKLYRKAKAEPAFRFDLLCDKICRDDILEYAYALAQTNGGAPGVDGESFAAIEAAGHLQIAFVMVLNFVPGTAGVAGLCPARAGNKIGAIPDARGSVHPKTGRSRNGTSKNGRPRT